MFLCCSYYTFRLDAHSPINGNNISLFLLLSIYDYTKQSTLNGESMYESLSLKDMCDVLTEVLLGLKLTPILILLLDV